MKPTLNFQKDLDAALSALGKETSAESISDDCPEPESVMAHVRGVAVDDQIATHLDSCSACSDLASVVRRQKKLYERQKQAFEQAAGERPPLVRTVRDAFQPLAWLARPTGIASAVAVVVVAASLVVWQGQNFKHPGSGGFGSASQLVVNIEQSDPHSPGLTEVSLQNIVSQMKQGERLDPAQIQQARSAVDAKKAAVSGTPALATQWDKIDDQLAVVEWWNRYQKLRKKGIVLYPVSGYVSDVTGSDGTGKVRLSWDPTLNERDLSLLKASLAQTDGLDRVIITTPANKTVTLASTDKQHD